MGLSPLFKRNKGVSDKNLPALPSGFPTKPPVTDAQYARLLSVQINRISYWDDAEGVRAASQITVHYCARNFSGQNRISANELRDRICHLLPSTVWDETDSASVAVGLIYGTLAIACDTELFNGQRDRATKEWKVNFGSSVAGSALKLAPIAGSSVSGLVQAGAAAYNGAANARNLIEGRPISIALRDVTWHFVGDVMRQDGKSSRPRFFKLHPNIQLPAGFETVKFQKQAKYIFKCLIGEAEIPEPEEVTVAAAPPVPADPNISIDGLHNQAVFGQDLTNVELGQGVQLRVGTIDGSRLFSEIDNQSGRQPNFGNVRIGSMSGGSEALVRLRFTTG